MDGLSNGLATTVSRDMQMLKSELTDLNNIFSDSGAVSKPNLDAPQLATNGALEILAESSSESLPEMRKLCSFKGGPSFCTHLCSRDL